VTGWRLTRPAKPRNWCASCGEDFTSARGFDRHRVGRHAYTFVEGLALSPPVEDGRRCLDVVEIAALGFERDERGRWRDAAEAERTRERFAGSELRTTVISLPGVVQDVQEALAGTPGRVAA